MQETLTCKQGNHSFTREVKRGKKPTLCPVHKAKLAETQAAQRKPRVLTEEHKTKLLAGKAEKEAAKESLKAEAKRELSAWIKRDAKYYRAYKSGEVTREEWVEVAKQIPRFL